MDRLHQAFSPVPPQVHQRVEAALEQIHHAPAPRKVIRPSLVLAAVLAVLVLLGAAFAAGYFGLADYLTQSSMNEVPVSVHNAVQSVQAGRYDQGVAVQLHEAVFDGTALALTMSMEAREPAYVILEDILINGSSTTSTICSTMHQGWIGNPFEKDMSCRVGSAAFLEERLTGDVEVEVLLSLMRSPGELVLLNMTDYPSYDAYYRHIDELILAGKTPVSLLDTDADPCYLTLYSVNDEVCQVIADRRGVTEWPERTDSIREVSERYSNLNHTGDMSLSFTIPAEQYANLTVSRYIVDGAAPIPCRLDHLEATELSFWLDMTLFPRNEDEWEAAQLIVSQTSDAWLDGDGQALSFISAPHYSYQLSGRFVEVDGRQGYHIEMHAGGLAAAPEQILLHPGGYDGDPLPQYNFTFRKLP